MFQQTQSEAWKSLNTPFKHTLIFNNSAKLSQNIVLRDGYRFVSGNVEIWNYFLKI